MQQYSANLQAAVTNTTDFEAAKLETNYAQAINLVLNGSSDLDSKLKQLKPNQNKLLISNIFSATITNNKLLAAIFPFEFKEPSQIPLLSRAMLKKKPITAMYTNAKVNDQTIKLILDSGHQVDCTTSTKIITANGMTKTPIGEINNFPIEVNDIIISIKILVMEATQYQALVGNDRLFKTNTMLD
ncbi:hypothetical protein G9A89_008907 [Geosiphon pyriformis]|nr:hypothetical protein G9A89_008907 [Geosiphon pyriformis]